LDINSYLILPVQRIPRYVLLLNDFINSTDHSHPDYDDLTDSLNLMKKVAEEINKSMNENENRRKCIELQTIFSEPIELVEAHREFVYEGDVIKQCRKAKKGRRLWLFNDILLYGKTIPASPKYLLSGKFELENFEVHDIPDDLSNHMENAIELISKTKSFVVFTESPQDKIKWLTHLKYSIETLTNRRKTFVKTSSMNMDNLLSESFGSDSAPIWIPDDKVVNCPLCNEKFTIILRKHHCRKCGNIVCNGCSKHHMHVPNVSTKEVRVCEKCFLSKSN